MEVLKEFLIESAYIWKNI